MSKEIRNRQIVGFASLVGLALVGAMAAAQEKQTRAPSQTQVPRDAKSPEQPQQKASPSREEAAVRALSEGFVTAYNKRDVGQVAAMFTDDARIYDDDGVVFEGKPAIQERFAMTFENPEAPRLRLEDASFRFPAPGVAIEDGVLVAEGPGGRRGAFTAIHVLKDGRWLTSEVRDRIEPPGAPDEGDASLAELDWLVGEWVDESARGVVYTNCKRSEDGHFLLREFSVKLRGDELAKGVQRIGWDPVRGQIRSWVFDSDGGFNEGFWTKIGSDRWVIRTSGYLRDGEPVAATNVVTKLGPDAFRWDSSDGTIGDVYLENIEELLIVRKPPAPK